MADPTEETEHRLPDGRVVLLRRLTPADSPGVADAFARLSSESRRLRFLGPKSHLTAAELRYLTDVDGHNHEALVAIDPATRRGVAIARFVRDMDDPSRAEVAVTVVDDWQRHGVATLLLERLSARAKEEGISGFTAVVAPENQKMQGLLTSLGRPVRVLSTAGGAVEYEVEVGAAGLGDRLRAALRAVAAGDLRLAPELSRELRSLMQLDRRRGGSGPCTRSETAATPRRSP